MGELVLFQDVDGKTKLNVRLDGNTVWLTQKQMTDLFAVDVRTVSEHLKNIFSSGELGGDSGIRKFRIPAADGKAYATNHYNLDAIISVGYRVNSKQGAKFRQWATQTLNDHLVKGFTLNQQHITEHGIREAQEAISLLSRTLLKQENLK